jgi:hypothetical protein
MAPRHKAGVRALNVYRADPYLKATVRSTVGYRAECDCGAHGPHRGRYAEARPDLAGLEHRQPTEPEEN